MTKNNAWIVKTDLINRFLDVLTNNDYKWMTGHKPNELKEWDDWGDKDTIIFIEEAPKIISFEGYSFPYYDPYKEYNLTEVTEEWLNEMEGVLKGHARRDIHIDILKNDTPIKPPHWVIWKDDDPANPLYVGYKAGNISIDDDSSSSIKYNESVSHPSHNNHGGLETIDIIKMLLTYEEYIGYLKGSFLKYREQAPYRGNTQQDYEKAKWYFDELMKVGNPSSVCFYNDDFENIVHEEEMM